MSFKKQFSPPKKYRKKENKFWEKQFWGIFRWGKKNEIQTKLKKISKNTHEYKYSLFQYMQT